MTTLQMPQETDLHQEPCDDALVGGNSANGFLIGGLIPVGVGQIRLSYSRYRVDQVTAAVDSPTSKKFAVGYAYSLFKRRVLYTAYAHVANSGGAAQPLNGAVTAANNPSTGFDFGTAHSF